MRLQRVTWQAGTSLSGAAAAAGKGTYKNDTQLAGKPGAE
jgi:hypothetical protein